MKPSLALNILITAIGTVSPVAGVAALHAHKWLTVQAPEIAAAIDPASLAVMTAGSVASLMSIGLAKWCGIPVAHLQQALKEQGLYSGRIDGLAGPKTRSAIAEAVNNPEIKIEGYPARKPRVVRMQGGKIR